MTAPANLSSRTATYLSIMANISAMYENNLGLRVIMQELILTPNTDAFDDVADGSGALTDFRNWVRTERPRGTYRWTVATKFGAVDGNGVLGVAFVGTAGATNGVSINRTGNVTVPTHEIGHNMGSGHTNGGVMNASANNSRDFFRNLETQSRTGAWAVYNFMSSGGANTQTRAFPSNRRLRHAEEIPFANDDSLSTLPNQSVRFRPMANDETSVLNGAENELTLVETGTVFPPGAGEAWVEGDEIEFRPAAGFDGTAWLSYTIRGSVGNGGEGWLHKGDVAIRIDGSGTNPPNLSSTTDNPDFIHHGGTGALVINPLVDDQGPGHLNVNHTTPTLGTSGSSTALTNGFFISNATLLDTSKGSLAFNRVDITLSGGSRVDLIRFLTFTPNAGASGPVRIQYTVTDGNGDEATQIATVLLGIEETLIDAPATGRFRIPVDASEDAVWMAREFDDSEWDVGDSGYGYENSTNGIPYTSLIATDTRAEMLNGGTALYLRMPFEIQDPTEFQSLRLQLQYDDGFSAMINGANAVSRNAPVSLVWDGTSTSNHEASLNSFDSFTLPTATADLVPGTNILGIYAVNGSATSSDFIIRPRLLATRKFTLGGIDHPKEISIPSGVGLVLRGFLRGISEAPFANDAAVEWTSLTAGAIFSDPAQAATTVTFPEPGNHTLRMRITESGYVEEHEIDVFVGSPAELEPGPLALAGPDLVIPAGGSHQLAGLTSNADQSNWTQISGPTASVSSAGLINFTANGAHTFRLSATGGGLTTFDDVTIVRGSGPINIAPLGSLSRHLVPGSPADLSDSAGNAWYLESFDASNWQREPSLYGYETNAGFQDLYQFDLQASMAETNSSVLVRLPFFSPVASPVTLALRYDDGFASHLNGIASVSSNSPALPLAWDSAALGNRPDAVVVTPEQLSLGTAVGGTNLLALQGLNSFAASSDFLLIPELSVEATAGDPIFARLVSNESAARFLVPTGVTSGWETNSFDDSDWEQSAAALGYERSNAGNFDEHFFTDVEPFIYEQNETLYLRIPFVVPDGFTVRSLSLRAKYDDGFVAYLNGTELARDRISGAPSWNSGISSSRGEALTTVYSPFDLDDSTSLLQPGLNLLAVQVINAGVRSSDFLFAPELIAELETTSASAYDQWFAAIPGTEGQDSAPDADLDRDGLDNLLEFAFGGNPIASQAVNLNPTISATEFSYRQSIQRRFRWPELHSGNIGRSQHELARTSPKLIKHRDNRKPRHRVGHSATPHKRAANLLPPKSLASGVGKPVLHRPTTFQCSEQP